MSAAGSLDAAVAAHFRHDELGVLHELVVYARRRGCSLNEARADLARWVRLTLLTPGRQ